MSSSNSNGLLKIIFLLHLILSSWGMQSAFTIPTSYIYTNLLFMIVLLWAIAHRTSPEAIGMAFLINGTVFIIDVITLCAYWPRGERHRIYLGFAIANTILRPVTCFLLYRIFRECDVERRGIRGLFGDVLDAPSGLLNNFNGGRREYRGTAAGTHDTTAPPPPGTVRSGYQPIDPNDPKMFE